MISLIKQEVSHIPTGFLCRHFGVSRSGYYEWQKDAQPARFVKKKTLCKVIKEIFQESRKTYGSPRVHSELKDRGFQVSENTVAKYMQELGLDARLRKKYRVQTTDSKHALPIAERLIKTEDENTMPDGPGEVLAGDITYLKLGKGYLYLAVVIDLYTREVVG